MQVIEIKRQPLDLQLINLLEQMIFGQTRLDAHRLHQIERLQPHLVVAYHGNKKVGFKLGYCIKDQQKFFSWLGGVHSSYRRQGIAQDLLNAQEDYVRSLALKTIYFTTFDRFPEMIALGKKNHYILVRTAQDGGEVKYWYEKHLI